MTPGIFDDLPLDSLHILFSEAVKELLDALEKEDVLAIKSKKKQVEFLYDLIQSKKENLIREKK